MSRRGESSNELGRKALAAAISAVFAGVNFAYAQSVDSDDAPQDTDDEQSGGPMEEVIVTATKRAESIQDVPIAVSAFTDEQIVQQGFKQLDDYAGQIPGLSFGRREPGGTTVLMRGCAVSGIAFSDSTTTSIYLDEQPITAGGVNPDPRLIDIKRIEALSGPQGTLFGDSSMCGSLRIITNKPDLNAFDSWVDVGFHTIDDGDNGFEISGMANIPLIEDKLALRLVGFTGEDAGYIDNVFGLSAAGTFDNAGFASDDVNTNDFDGMRAGLRWAINDNWTLDANFSYQSVDLDGFGDVDLNQQAYAGRSIGSTEQIRFGKDDWEDDWYQIALTLEGSTRFGDLMITASYFDREIEYNADASTYDFFFQQVSDAYGPNYYFYDFGGDPRGFAFDDVDTYRTTVEARLTSPADSTSRWHGLVGVFYNSVDENEVFHDGVFGHANTNSFAYLDYLQYAYFGFNATPTDAWFSANYESSLDQWAVFGEVTFDVTDNFAITAGGRYFDVETDRLIQQGYLVPEPVPGTKLDCTIRRCIADDTGDSDENDFIPKLTLAYHLDDQKMLYGTYSEGFRRGGGNAARAGSVFGPGGPLNVYDSDSIDNYEIGAKTTWFNGAVRFNITAYHMVWDDIQIEGNDPQPNIFAVGIANAGEAEIDGGEAWFDWVPLEGLQFSGTLGYNDAELSETTVGPSGLTFNSGTPLPLMPDWKASASGQYYFQSQVFNSDPWVSLDFEHTGESINSISGLQSITFSNPPRVQSSYNKWGLSAGLDNEKWSARFYVDNMFDEDEITFYNDRWAQQRGTILRPRTYGLNFRMYFD